VNVMRRRGVLLLAAAVSAALAGGILGSAPRTATAARPVLRTSSQIDVGGLIRDAGKAALSSVTGGAYVGASQPRCSSSGRDQASVAWAPSASRALLWCHGRNSDGSETVQVVNNKRYAVVVSDGGGLQRVGGASDGLSAQLSNLLNRPNQITLAAGGSATFRAPVGTSAGAISSDYDGFAQAMTSLVTAADIISAVAARMPFSKFASGKQVMAMLDLGGCVRAAGINPTALLSHPISSLVSLFKDCFSANLLKRAFGTAVGGLISAAIGVVASTVSYFLTSGQALFDQFVSGARYSLRITVPLCPRLRLLPPSW
jgi:hypothetical protein